MSNNAVSQDPITYALSHGRESVPGATSDPESVKARIERATPLATRDGITITEVDPLCAYVATADGYGYGPDTPTEPSYVPPTYAG